MARVLTYKDYQLYYGKNPNIYFQNRPGLQYAYMTGGSYSYLGNYSDTNKVSIENSINSRGNKFAYDIVGTYNYALTTDNVTKRGTSIDLVDPTLAEGLASGEEAGEVIRVTRLGEAYNLLISYSRPETIGLFILPSSMSDSSIPYKLNYCIKISSLTEPSGDTKWYYRNNNSWVKTNFQNMYYYYHGGHGSDIYPPGTDLCFDYCLGIKIYTIKYDSMGGTSFSDIYEYLEYENITKMSTFFRPYIYHTYGYGFLKNWPELSFMLGDTSESFSLYPWYYYDQRMLDVGEEMTPYCTFPQLIGQDLLNGCNFIGIELAVCDCNVSNYYKYQSSLYGLVTFTKDHPLASPVLPWFGVYTSQSRELNTINVAPEILGSSWDSAYKNVSTQIFGLNYAGKPLLGSASIYGLFYLLPICDRYLDFDTVAKNLLYSINRFGVMFHNHGNPDSIDTILGLC